MEVIDAWKRLYSTKNQFMLMKVKDLAGHLQKWGFDTFQLASSSQKMRMAAASAATGLRAREEQS
jgi:hypothetical protein